MIALDMVYIAILREVQTEGLPFLQFGKTIFLVLA